MQPLSNPEPSMEPTISVIIPAYNMGAFVEAAIRSVLEGNFASVEVICVDDGSADDTGAVVQAFTDPDSPSYDPRVRYIYQPNQGKPAAVNQGLDQANGDYITILDADDRLPPDSLTVRYEAAVRTDPPADMVVGGFEVFDADQTYGERRPPVHTNPQALWRSFYLSYKTPFHFNASLVARSLIEQVGPHDHRLPRCEDGDYAIRCLKECRKLVIVEETVYRYRKYRSSARERVQMRWATAQTRTIVLWKHFSGIERLAVVPYGWALDAAKMAFEVFDNYKQ